MYSKVVYDYFNSCPKKFKFKPNKLTRNDAFKNMAIRKTVVVPKKSNTSAIILKSSSPIEDASQKPTQNMVGNSTRSVVYDTVQCIWKYAKIFVSNQNSNSSKNQDQLGEKSKYRSSIKNNDFSSFLPDEKEISCDPIQATNEELSSKNISQEMEESTQYDEKINEDFFTIENLETSKNLQELKAQSFTEINLEFPEKHSVSEELGYNEKSTSTNYDQHVANKETQTIIPDDDDVSLKVSIKKNQRRNKLTENNNSQDESDNLNIKMHILKSTMKKYGRGKRKNKKLLHVHFKDEYDNETRKYSTYTSKMLRKSDCYHPNAFYKKFQIKQSAHSIRDKKKCLALRAKTSKSYFQKNISSNKNIDVKKTRKAPKHCNNKKSIKTLQKVIETIVKNKFDELFNISYNDTHELLKAINFDELCSIQHSLTVEHDHLFGENQEIFESSHFLEELNEFTEFINGE